MDCGDHDDGKIGLQRVDPLQQRDAIHILHHDVGEHQVEGIQLQSFECFAAAAGQFDGITLAFQRGSHHGAHGRFVVDHENSRRLA